MLKKEVILLDNSKGLKMTERVNALVLAGGNDYIGGVPKVLVEVGGYPIIRYVLDALKKSKNVKDITIVGNKKLLQDKLGNEYRIVPEIRGKGLSGIINNTLVAGRKALSGNNDDYLLITASDIILANAAAFDYIISKSGREYDVNYPLCKKEDVERFINVNGLPKKLKKHHWWGRFENGKYRVANCSFVNFRSLDAKLTEEKIEILKKIAEENRRFGLLAKLRLTYHVRDIAWKGLLHKLTFEYIMYRAEELTGLNLNLFESTYVETAIDFDSEKQKHSILSLENKLGNLKPSYNQEK